MVTIQKYKQAGKRLKIVERQENKEERKLKKEEEEFYHKYNALEQDLQDKKYKERQKLSEKREQVKKEFDNKEEPHLNKISEFKRILKFIEISKEPRDLDFKAYSYGGFGREKRYLKPIDTKAKDDFKHIQILIYQNDKPKNKFSLCFAGATIFNEDLMKNFPKSYGIHITKDNGYFSIEGHIKDMPTEQELKDYYEKNKDKILKEFLEEHKKVEQEYIGIIEKTRDSKGWEIAYYEDLKDYYENRCCRGTETKEYKKVIKKLKDLTK